MQKNTGKIALSNFIWRFFERTGAQLVSLVISIVLARLLSPSDYGVVALMWVIINFLSLFIDAGFSTALIQKKDTDDLDYSTVFYFNVICCIIIYVILFLFAPLIAGFYSNPKMTPMIRVAGITLLISGVKSIQIAYVSKNLLFKKFFFSTLGGTIGAAFVGIWIAMRGLGAWALICQSLFNNLVDTIILWCTVRWRPKRIFSLERLKRLLNFGIKIQLSSLINHLYEDLRSLLIGKIYGPQDLAFYDKGRSWPNLVTANINSSLDSVLLPILSGEQDNPERIKEMTKRVIKTSIYILAPMMMGLAACSRPLIRFLLTEKWLPCVPFQIIFCITYMFYPIHTANLNAIKALGRSDLFLKLEILKKIVGLTLLVITAPISVKAMAYSLLVSSLASQIINSWPNKKLLNYSYLDQLRDILPSVLLAFGMGAVVYLIQFLKLDDLVTLLIQVLLGASIYVVGSRIFKLDSFDYMLSMTKSYMFRSQLEKSESK